MLTGGVVDNPADTKLIEPRWLRVGLLRGEGIGMDVDALDGSHETMIASESGSESIVTLWRRSVSLGTHRKKDCLT